MTLCLQPQYLSAIVVCLGALTTDATGQLHILELDRHALGVNGTQVGIFKETDQVSL